MIGLALGPAPRRPLPLCGGAADQPLRDGPMAPIAASELQRVVKEVPAGANVDARSERVLPPTNLAELQEVPVELTVAVGQPRELLTTLTVAGYLLPAAGGN